MRHTLLALGGLALLLFDFVFGFLFVGHGAYYSSSDSLTVLGGRINLACTTSVSASRC